ncbi:MAG: response regulator transcription factor [Deltaproteobacteria bacterium]|nr:response regulator transcription factor [Deltaproteobacteria bacterium]
MERVLIIDDDTGLCELLIEYLTPEGFQVDAVHDGQSGADQACMQNYDMIVLDVMLPKKNGFEVLQQLRSRISTPVVMLTARGDDVDRIIGLEMGADDYLPKPFNPRELVARIRAVLRRVKPDNGEMRHLAGPDRLLMVGDVRMDLGTHGVTCADAPIELTAVEFNLLEHLLRNAGRLVSRKYLAKTVLGREMSSYDRSIDVHVSKLRKKLGLEPAGMERIKTIRGVGYLYVLSG